MSKPEVVSTSPKWSATTKLIVGLSLVAIVALLTINFRTIIGPLLLAFVFTYLLHPLAGKLSKLTGLKWRASVNLVFLFFIILVITFLTIAGLAVVQQVQSVIELVNYYVDHLPTLAAELSTKVYQFGPFEFNLNQFDLQAISQQLLSALQPLLGRVGGLLSTLATGAAVIFGWGLFVLLISYFVLVDAGQVSGELFSVELPGYSADIRRLGIELRNIWNAFLRGQFVIFLLVIVIFSILATVLGVRYSLAIALLAGVARFVPYVGPLTTYGVMVLVILLQGNHIFGLAAWQHALLVIGVCLLLDQTLDSLIVPRFLGDALGVHPAAVLLAAIIAANLIGLVGLVLAAPVVATLKLLGRYSFRKMLDLDPWPPSDKKIRIMEYPWERWTRRVRAWLRLKSR